MILEKRSLDDIIEDLNAPDGHGANVTCHDIEQATVARFEDFPSDLHPALKKALSKLDILRPYSHQARAITLARAGEHVALTTPTASGKSLCYNLPVLERILNEPESRALYIFPTKALSQDQYSTIHALIEATEVDIGTFTFDGDTPPDARRAVRDHGHVVITNPDMLHAGVLPQHTKWLKLFENLKYVVIDELHTYRGIFGSHVSNLLSRLRRICAFYGSNPQFILCSATIANPADLAFALTGIEPKLVTESGAPRGERHFVAYNPPVVNRQLGIRAGVIRTTHNVARELIVSGVSTIVFAGSRLHVEVILKYLRESMVRANLSPELVQGYRGGYLPNHRRRIEGGLRSGDIRAVVTTNALELGIDIGSLQACVIAGYPGSIASLRQQAGRAGRRSGKALTVWVARSSSLDQYLVNHPDIVIGASPEHARLNPKNLFVLVDHMKCAAFEMPFEADERYAGLSLEETQEVLSYLQTHGVLHESGGRYHWTQRVFPATHISLRGMDEENFVVVDLKTDRVLAEVDFRSAHTSLYLHAIYNCDGKQFQVERLDYENHKAYVRPVEPDYYTTAMTYSRVSILEEDQSRAVGNHALCHGEVLVTQKFVGFKKLKFHTNENVGYGDIELPDLEMHTTAMWLTLKGELLTELEVDLATALDGLAALTHALHTTGTVTLMCTARDIGRSIGDRSAETSLRLDERRHSFKRDGHFEPTVFLYDNAPGGFGLAKELFKRFHHLIQHALELLERCQCRELGCPACSGPMPSYTGDAKSAAMRLAKLLSMPSSSAS
jgi:DEAD/DEAH box helicase domain-containing protein